MMLSGRRQHWAIDKWRFGGRVHSGSDTEIPVCSMSTTSQNTWGDKSEDMHTVNLVSSVINELKNVFSMDRMDPYL